MTPRVLCIFIFKKKDLLSLFSEDILVDHVRAGCIKSCTLVHLFCECEDWKLHVLTWGVTEHLLKLNLLCVHEECVVDVHRTDIRTLTAVDTGVCDVCEADHLEHEVRREDSRLD